MTRGARWRLGIALELCVVCLALASAFMDDQNRRAVWSLIRPFRDAAIAENQFRALVGSLSAETTHDSVRQALERYRELGYADDATGTRIYLLAGARRSESEDWLALLAFKPDGRLLYLSTGYFTSSTGPVPGFPEKRCFVPQPECDRLLRELFEPARRVSGTAATLNERGR